MTTAKFLFHGDVAVSFEIKGHSGAGSEGNDIVCSAVSSAAFMAANTIIEVLNLSPKTEISDGYMKIQMTFHDAEKAKVITDGLWIHLNGLAEQYPYNLKLERGVFNA